MFLQKSPSMQRAMAANSQLGLGLIFPPNTTSPQEVVLQIKERRPEQLALRLSGESLWKVSRDPLTPQLSGKCYTSCRPQATPPPCSGAQHAGGKGHHFSIGRTEVTTGKQRGQTKQRWSGTLPKTFPTLRKQAHGQPSGKGKWLSVIKDG